MKLAVTLAVYAGGQGSGCKGPNCGRPTRELSKVAVKKEVDRLTPLASEIGKAWKSRIKQLDPKAKIEISVSPTGLFHQENFHSPMVLESTWGVNIYLSGESGKGERFGIGIGLFPESNGNTLKIQDSNLPDKWQGKGVFSAGIKKLVSNPKFNLNKEMTVHMDTNPKAWTAIAKKFGFTYNRK